MNIEEIRKDITNHIGKTIKIKYNLGRNKYEEYEVIIKELYDNVFLVEYKNFSGTSIKSFAYRDVMTKLIHIDY